MNSYLLFIPTRKRKKPQGESYFQKFYFSDNHGNNICRQQLPLRHYTMLHNFYKDLHFISISQHC